MFTRSGLKRLLVPIAALCLLAAPLSSAGAQTVTGSGDSDPLEPLNRGLYAVHRGLDKVIVRPLMLIYTGVLPNPVRTGLHNVVLNLGEPLTFVNDVLQVRPRAAGRTLVRFGTNSTIGVLGVFDMAGDAGFPREYADFGQTLGRYGVGPGPYIFIPVLGPSNMRDVAARVADNYLDPTHWVHYEGDEYVRYGRPIVNGLELRAFFDSEFQELDRTATDPYVTLRSAYLQSRQSVISGGEVNVEDLPSFDPVEPAASAPETPTVAVEGATREQAYSARASFFRSIE